MKYDAAARTLTFESTGRLHADVNGAIGLTPDGAVVLFADGRPEEILTPALDKAEQQEVASYQILLWADYYGKAT